MGVGGNQLKPVQSTQSISATFSPLRETLFITLVCMAQFMTQTNVGVCLPNLDILKENFGITDSGILSWFLAGYSLTVGTFIIIFGRCGDLFGYRRMFFTGFIWLAIWSLVAGVRVYLNHILFIIARVLQGIGSAMLLPNGLAFLGATYLPGKKKSHDFRPFRCCCPKQRTSWGHLWSPLLTNCVVAMDFLDAGYCVSCLRHSGIYCCTLDSP